jgi:hypothetical protein
MKPQEAKYKESKTKKDDGKEGGKERKRAKKEHKRGKGGSPVHVAPACAELGEGSDHFGSRGKLKIKVLARELLASLHNSSQKAISPKNNQKTI